MGTDLVSYIDAKTQLVHETTYIHVITLLSCEQLCMVSDRVTVLYY